MSYREIIATAVIIQFLNSQPGEFTPAEIRRMAHGFHCDTDESDVEFVCGILANNKQISIRRDDTMPYLAFAAHSLTRECHEAGTDWMPQGWKPLTEELSLHREAIGRLQIPGCEMPRAARSTDDQY